MKHSEQIAELATAMCVVQGQVVSVIRNKENPFLKNDYADLDAILSFVRKKYADAGVWIVENLEDVIVENVRRPTLSVRFIHGKSGQWLECGPVTVLLREESKGLSPAQALKAAVTLTRRTLWLAAMALAEADDDGNDTAATTGKTKPKAAPPPAMKEPPAKLATPPPPPPPAWKQTIGKDLLAVTTEYSGDKAVAKEFCTNMAITEEAATKYLEAFKKGNFADFDAWTEGKGK